MNNIEDIFKTNHIERHEKINALVHKFIDFYKEAAKDGFTVAEVSRAQKLAFEIAVKPGWRNEAVDK